jgi:hypothetical protein
MWKLLWLTFSPRSQKPITLLDFHLLMKLQVGSYTTPHVSGYTYRTMVGALVDAYIL